MNELGEKCCRQRRAARRIVVPFRPASRKLPKARTSIPIHEYHAPHIVFCSPIPFKMQAPVVVMSTVSAIFLVEL